MSDQPQSSLFLVMRRGPQPNQSFSINKDIVTIGRALDNDIVINNPGISDYHAHLIRSGDYWVIEDLRTPNGVLVNGKRIMQPVILTPGCQVALGANVLLTMEGEVPLASWQSAAQQPQAGVPAGKPRPRWPILAGLAGVTGLLILGGLALVAGGVLAYFYWYLPSMQPAAAPELVYPVGPTVTFLEPSSGLQVGAGESFLVFANARDEQGVVRIDLWVDDQLVVQQDSPDPNGVTPFNLVQGMTAVTPGVHSLYARAYNKQGDMGESPALYVTVFDQVVVAPAAETSFFIVQQGDTLDNIAVITNSNVPAIQAANPGLGPVVRPGQVVAIPPHPPLPAPPAQPGQQPVHPPLPVPPAQPGQMGALPPNQPGQPGQIPGLAGLFGGQMAGIAPNQPGGGGGGQAAMIQPPQPGQLDPSFFPAGNAANPPNSPLKAPQGLSAKADGCIVSLSWNPQGTNAEGFAIYRRQQGSPNAVLLKTIEGSKQFTQDKAPYAAIYEYAVEALIYQPQQVGNKITLLNAARSGYVKVDVKVSPNCIEDPKGFLYLYFQVRDVTLKGPNKDVALRYSINESVARRIPVSQQQYHSQGTWNIKEAIPEPASLYGNPLSPVVLHIWGTTRDLSGKKPSPDLPTITADHIVAQLVDPKNRDNIYQAKGQDYNVTYYLWMEVMVWDPDLVQAGGAKLEAPILRIERTTVSSRVLKWDWNGDKNTIDGYILYRSYSCPGQNTEIRAPQALPISPQEIEVKFKTEPVGCAYRYQLTAYGRQGESNPSNAVEGETSSVYAGVFVSFTDIKFNNLPNTPIEAKINLYANEYNRITPPVWIKGASFDLSAFEMNGAKPNNNIVILLAENEELQLGFVVSEITADGFEKTASVCQGFSIQDPVRTWKDTMKSTTIRSADSACEVTVGFEWKPDVGLKSGETVRPQADLALGPNIAQLGDSIYVYVLNIGPDALPNNMATLNSEWQCAFSKQKTRVGYGLTTLYRPSPYLSSSDGQWVRIESYDPVRVNQMRRKCYEYLSEEDFFPEDPTAPTDPPNEWLEQNVMLGIKAFIEQAMDYDDPNPSNNTVQGFPGPME